MSNWSIDETELENPSQSRASRGPTAPYCTSPTCCISAKVRDMGLVRAQQKDGFCLRCGYAVYWRTVCDERYGLIESKKKHQIHRAVNRKRRARKQGSTPDLVSG